MGTIYFNADNGQSKGIIATPNTNGDNAPRCVSLYKGKWACSVPVPTGAESDYITQTYSGTTFKTKKVSSLFVPPTGYQFSGWRIWDHTCNAWVSDVGDATFSQATVFAENTTINFAASSPVFVSGDELWMYPNMVHVPYTVTYNANGGKGAPASQTKNYGSTLTLSSTKPTRAGYTFKNWNTAANGTGTAYAADGKYTANANAILYAQWTANPSVTLTYNVDGDTSVLPMQTVHKGENWTVSTDLIGKSRETQNLTITYNVVNPDAVLDGASTQNVVRQTTYTFKCWNTRSDGKGTSYNPGAKILASGNLTLYAIWTTKSTGSAELRTATLAQHTLLGWSTKTGSTDVVPDPYSPTKSITLYAVWISNAQTYLQFDVMDTTEPEFTVGRKIRIMGFKDASNDGVYTINASTITPIYDRELSLMDQYTPDENDELIGYTVTLEFQEPFQTSGQQDAGLYNLKIYDDGVYVPDMDYICALNNRLWGCSSENRTIYASALGEPADFWTFSGNSLDAYQVAVGSAGPFTGCVAMNNHVVFFKQHTVHKMMGNYPAEYTLYTYDLDGISESNGLSAINAGGAVIYVSESGISMFNGSSTSILSTDLGKGGMHDAIAGYDVEKYFLSFKDDAGETKTYIFDTRYRLWLQDDLGDVKCFAHLIDQNYMLEAHSDGNAIYRLDTALPHEGDWEMVFREMYEHDNNGPIFEKKRYTHITFRLDLPEGSWLKAEVKTDDGRWHPVARTLGRKKRVQDFVFRTPRSDKMQLRLSGHGSCTILGMERTYITGSRRS